jgi:hypothetical protein
MLTGAWQIVAERSRHEALGWSPEHDDEYRGGELVMAAVCYALTHDVDAPVPGAWPFKPAEWHPSADHVENLRKAGALLAAEIDRIMRARDSVAVLP